MLSIPPWYNAAMTRFYPWPDTFQPSTKMMNNPTDMKIMCLIYIKAALLKYICPAGAYMVSSDFLLDEIRGRNAGVTTHKLETQGV